jgi:dihydroorotase
VKITRDEGGGVPVRINMRKPADMHQHLRQDAMLELVAPMVAERFAMAIVMPNTTPPITSVSELARYGTSIAMAIHGRVGFKILGTFYLTNNLDPVEVETALKTGLLTGIKYYPPGLTTNSDSGVQNPASLWTRGTNPYECLRVLANNGGVFLIHAADGIAAERCTVNGRSYQKGEMLDPYDQEVHFITFTLQRIRLAHPDLKISVEHLSTATGAAYMRSNGGDTLGCSLTAQHLLLDRRDSFSKGKQMGFNPHRFWWPIIQPKEHRDELRRFAAEGHPFVWLGSDSAPHPVGKKLADCCTGGVLMAHAGIELYVEAFENMNCLDKLENFASVNGPRFYGLEPSNETITLVCEEWKPETLWFGEPVSEAGVRDRLIPFRLGETIRWKLAS